jgi:hypothetical protein
MIVVAKQAYQDLPQHRRRVQAERRQAHRLQASAGNIASIGQDIFRPRERIFASPPTPPAISPRPLPGKLPIRSSAASMSRSISPTMSSTGSSSMSVEVEIRRVDAKRIELNIKCDIDIAHALLSVSLSPRRSRRSRSISPVSATAEHLVVDQD